MAEIMSGNSLISGIVRKFATDNAKTPIEKIKLAAHSAFSLYNSRKHVKSAQTPTPSLIVRAMSSAKGKAILDARSEEAALESESGGQDSSSHSQNGTTDAARLAELERSVSRLQNRVKELEKDRPLKNGESSSSENRPQTLITPLAPHLRCSKHETKLFGPTHWAHVFQQFHHLRSIRGTAIYEGVPKNEISKSLKEARTLRWKVKNWQKPHLLDPTPNLLGDLPAKEVCDELVQSYLRTMELIYRVLHVPSFKQEYETFWVDPQSTSTGFLTKLLLVMSIGALFYFKPGPSNELRLPIRRWLHAAQWWLTGPTARESATLQGLQVYCLLLLCRQAYAIDKWGNWNSAGSLLRLATSQGLHRDPQNFSRLSAFDTEMRRRIWMTILELNLQLSIDVSMPPLISVDDYDTLPPSNLDDEDFDATNETLPGSKNQSQYTDSSFQVALAKSFVTRLCIARNINDCNREQSYEEALALGVELTAASKEIAILFHGYISHAAGRANGPTVFHQRLLDTIIHRLLLNLYRPFALKALSDPRFYLSRKLSLNSALVMASHGETNTNSDDQLQQSDQDFFRLCLSGAGLFKGYLSPDVIVVIGLELITQIEEEACNQSAVPSQTKPDAVNKLAQATQAPLLEALERISDHLYQSIAAGIPSLKRYGLLNGMIAQITSASRDEQGIQEGIRQSMTESLETSRVLLQAYISSEINRSDAEGAVLPGGVDIWTPDSGILSSLGSDLMMPDLAFDSLSFWDIAPLDATGFDASALLRDFE
ncbi:uncharacterized protein N7511_010410 [Penicillium nucicola]|uniref:uncharacterized protein n=1 Tax=Penicillium nucicola TaxID=1850975 RepID=UPI0025452994|nr:uncharacterized protein N7511_010410 [Penicillium nucicola]KAJ5748714.1 hypothetical protein N7511_010410 [Penicillium nucicola]